MAGRRTFAFLKSESGSGLLLVLAALTAVAMANSPWAALYQAIDHTPIVVRIGAFEETLDLAEWVKQGLMTIFFLVVGLEIKLEVLRGELSSPRRLALPLLAAIGGMIVPAIVYLALNQGAGGTPQGWPVPVATDIAFALAALAVAAPRLPSSLRTFLLALAIADDLGAVALIGLLYSGHIDTHALAGAVFCLAGLALLGRWRQAPLFFYAAGFLLVWGFAIKSGVNPSVAGVACAFTVPLRGRRIDEPGLLRYFMESLQPYVGLFILPLFAFTAAGFAFSTLSGGRALSPISVGVAVGLLAGKPVGILGFAWLGAELRLARRPAGATWSELAGVALLCGAGFTMSLFIGALAFGPDNTAAQAQVRLGVITGSLASVLAGGAVLAWRQQRRRAAGGPGED